jgi:hypothetical protein
MSEKKRDQPENPRIKRLLEWMREPMPEDFEKLVAALQEGRRVFVEEIGSRLEPAFNAEVVRRPHGTYEEKKELSKWVNHELRGLGLTLACPKTGLPAYVTGNTGSDRRVGRFVFHALQPDGTRFVSLSAGTLPRLRLLPALTEHHRQPWVDRLRGEKPPESDGGPYLPS